MLTAARLWKRRDARAQPPTHARTHQRSRRAPQALSGKLLHSKSSNLAKNCRSRAKGCGAGVRSKEQARGERLDLRSRSSGQATVHDHNCTAHDHNCYMSCQSTPRQMRRRDMHQRRAVRCTPGQCPSSSLGERDTAEQQKAPTLAHRPETSEKSHDLE